MIIEKWLTFAVSVLFIFFATELLAQTNVTGYIVGVVMTTEAEVPTRPLRLPTTSLCQAQRTVGVLNN